MKNLIFGLIILFNSYTLWSQNYTDTNYIIKGINAQTFTPYGSSVFSNLFSNLSISSFFKEGVNGKIDISEKLGKTVYGGISVDQKIGANDKEATPIDLNGVSPGTTVEFNLSKIFWKPRFTTDTHELMKLTNEYAKRKKIDDPRTVGLKEIADSGTDEEKKAAYAIMRSGVTGKEPLFVNFKIGFTKTAFKYATDSVTLSEIHNDYITPTVSLALIKYYGKGFKVNGYVAAGYNYSESYTAADDITFSIPFGTTANYYSKTISFGKPEQEHASSIGFEWRQNINTNSKNEYFQNVGTGLTIKYRFDNKYLSVMLPIYVLRGTNSDNNLIQGLQGGIRLGYISSTAGMLSSLKDGFTAQLIITEPLDFLNGQQ